MGRTLKIRVLGKDYEIDPNKYSKAEIDRMYNDAERGLAEIQNKRNVFEKEHTKILELRQEARDCEKMLQYDKAISLYEQSVLFGELSDNMKLNMYSFDIERLIILYGKTKQIDILKDFLTENIKKYPRSQDAKKWRERLKKIKDRR